MRQKIAIKPDGYKYDWSTARTRFIEGDPDPKNPDQVTYMNLRELAEDLKLPYGQLRAKAGKERWSEERATAQLKLAQERRKLRAKNLASESINFDDQSLSIAKIGQGLIAARFGEIAQELRARKNSRDAAMERLTQGNFVDPIELRSAVWFKEVSELANAASRIQEVGRRALGIDIEQIAITMDQDINVKNEVTVKQEMASADSERLAQMLQIAGRANIPILNQVAAEDEEDWGDEEGIVEAEVVGDDSPSDES